MSDQIAQVPNPNIDVSVERGKARLLALLFCDFTNTTNDKKPNLLGVFDRIYVDPEQPITPPFVAFIRVAEVTDSFDITMIGPDDLPAFQIKSVPSGTAFTEGLPRQVQTAILLQFEIKREGVFWLDISYRGVSLGGAGLTIEYRKGEVKQSGTDTYI